MGPLVSKWREEYAQRLNWAERAYQEFLENIDPDLARYFSPQEKEASVVLFGKTQVGKTTLLLKLMGVRDEVAKLLRGGQGRGKSATATAIRYSESPDDLWRLKDDQGDEQIWDDSSLEEKLRNLRQRVESGYFRSDRPVEIKIPLKYFEGKNNRLFRINILDLPGENARNEWEAAHVKRVAQKYVPIADLILLVGRGDDLSFLKSDSLSIPEIEDWRYTPDRFRIITTYSTRADSFIDWLNTLTNPTKACFRRRLLEQIETHDYLLPNDINVNNFFPLEFGDSWNALKEKEVEIFRRVKPVIEGLFDDLFKSISLSATPHARIMSAAKLYVVAEKHKLKKMAFFKEEIATLLSRKEEQIKSLDLLKIQKENISNKIESLSKEFKKLPEVDYCKLCDESIFLDNVNSGVKMDRECLYDYLSEKKEELILRFNNLVENLREKDVDIYCIKKKITSCIDSHVWPVRKYLKEEYWFDTYLSDDNFSKDKRKCVNAILLAVRDINELCKIKCDDVVSEKKIEYMKKIRVLKNESSGIAQTVFRISERIGIIERNIERLEEEYAMFCMSIEDSIQQGKIFKEKLLHSFDFELKNKLFAIKNESSHISRLVLIISSVLMGMEKQKLFVTE